MNTFLSALKSHNEILYWFGLVCLIAGVFCAGLVLATTVQVAGVNAFLKPAKFFVSIALFSWTMGWITGLLFQQRDVLIYSWVVVITMTLEMVIITGQAALGKLSHFNTTSAFDAGLFGLMGVAVAVLTIWTAYVGYLFFRLGPVTVDPGYLWGIRLGIFLFVIFAFEGFLMGARLSHTVGAADGSAGLPIANWSMRYGDLRVAHFFGMHALQLIPLIGYFASRQPGLVIMMALVYFLFVTFLLVQALAGKPVWAGLWKTNCEPCC